MWDCATNKYQEHGSRTCVIHAFRYTATSFSGWIILCGFKMSVRQEGFCEVVSCTYEVV